jgi:two-component system, NarL family, sensor kinase
MEKWQNPETIAIWIIVAIVFLLILLAFIVLLVKSFFTKVVKSKLAESKLKLEHQQNLLESSIVTQEKERKRIASDLHDDLIGKLTIIKLKIENSSSPSEDAVKLISESISSARRISHDLSPPLLEFSSTSELLEALIEPLKHISPYIDVRTAQNDSSDFKIQLIRIAQEVITNITKHAQAKTIGIHFRQSKSRTILKISDNGVGFEMENNKPGLGLKNIETRVNYLKGRYRVKSEKGKGTTSLFIFKT